MASLEVRGLQPLIRELRGPMLRDVNKELRAYSMLIAKDLVPLVSAAVARSGAPQAAAVSRTVRAHSDRVPVVVIGKTNPKGMRQRPGGAPIKRRRGAVAHGVVYGPKGGRADTPAPENYYRIARDSSGGPVGRALADGGPVFDEACELYLRMFAAVMRHHGFVGQAGKANAMRWGG